MADLGRLTDEGTTGPKPAAEAGSSTRAHHGAGGAPRLPDTDHPVTDDLGSLVEPDHQTPPLPPPTPEVVEAAPGSTRLSIHWHSLSDGLIFALVVGGPCLLAIEGLRHREGKLWLIPLVLAAVGFLIAGGIAGRHRRRPIGAILQGVAVALPVVVLLVLTDLLYRIIGHQPINPHVLATLLASIVGAVVVAAIGALGGRWLYLSGKRRRRSPGT